MPVIAATSPTNCFDAAYMGTTPIWSLVLKVYGKKRIKGSHAWNLFVGI